MRTHDISTKSRRERLVAHLRNAPTMLLRLGVAALLAGILASCGTSQSVTLHGGSSGSTSATPTTTSSAPSIPGQTSVRPCLGVQSGATSVGTPTRVLTPRPEGMAEPIVAHVGDLLQVRLPSTQVWQLTSTPPADKVTVLQPAGYENAELAVCIWNVRAKGAGTVTLSFTGTANCEPSRPCPAYASRAVFTIEVM